MSATTQAIRACIAHYSRRKHFSGRFQVRDRLAAELGGGVIARATAEAAARVGERIAAVAQRKG